MKCSKLWTIGLVLCLALVCPQLNAQQNQGFQLLSSTEMYAKRALSGDPKAASFCYELVPGVRFNNSIQLEIPFGLGVSFEQKGDHVLARQGYAGIAVGYLWGGSDVPPIALKVQACSTLKKGDYAGVDLALRAQLFIDKGEHAFLSLGVGRFFSYDGNHSSWSLQAGIGIRLKRRL